MFTIEYSQIFARRLGFGLPYLSDLPRLARLAEVCEICQRNIRPATGDFALARAPTVDL
jgi:hypothetical protein